MIGLPPLAGFVSKWYLAQGGLDAGAVWVIALLLGSSLLNAAYFLPMLHRAWFRDGAQGETEPARPRIGWWLVAPPVTTALMVLAVGGFANAPFSPLEWTRFVVAIEYQE